MIAESRLGAPTEVAGSAGYVEVNDVQADTEFAIRLDRPGRQDELAGRDHRDDLQLRIGAGHRRVGLALQVASPQLDGEEGKEVMAERPLKDEAVFGVEVDVVEV